MAKRFEMPVLRRILGKLVHDVLPAALASLIGGLLITHFHLDAQPVHTTVRVTPASPEMMQLLRDEHGLIVNYVKARVDDEKRQLLAAEKAERAPADAPPRATSVATPAAPAMRPTAAVALARPPAPRKVAVVGVSSPPIAILPPAASENVPPVAREDDSLLAKTLGIKDHVVAATQRAVSVIGGIPSWIGSIGDRIGGEGTNPRPPADLVSQL